MDPLSALALAGNIVQFVEVGTKLFSKAREIYRCERCSDEHNELDCMKKDLRRIRRSLESGQQNAQGTIPDPTLLELADRSEKLASELVEMLESVRSTSHSKAESIRLAFKSYLQKDKMDNLQTRLSAIRQQIILHLQNSSRLQLLSIEEGMSATLKTLQDFDSDQRQAIAGLTPFMEKLERAVGDLSYMKTDLNAFYKTFFNLMGPESKRRRIFLMSLQYSTMTSRYLNIKEAHEKTFHWIFDGQSLPSTDPRSQIALHDWLRSGNGIFWVTGKPGSGKSTLMKYLCEHPEAMGSLRQWAGTQHLVVAKFFFWHAGTSMQKSLQGLLQSLVFEILNQNQEWIFPLCPSRWAKTSGSDSWSKTELMALLTCLARRSTGPSKFCFFIDGLDEYDGDTYDILDCLRDINCSANIKLCLSSRRWNCFEDSFGEQRTQKLYLEDLNKGDIAAYARGQMSAAIGRSHGMETDSALVDNLTLDIIGKAQGVFLWVVLAVKSLQRGLTNGDSPATLQQRLHQFPSELSDFFKQILDQIEGVYKVKTPVLFKVALESPHPLKLIAFSFLMEDDAKSALRIRPHLLSPVEFKKRWLLAKRRLEACCKGLLEVQVGEDHSVESRRMSHSSEVGVVNSADYTTIEQDGVHTCPHEVVGFLHRSFRDYLLHEDRSWENALPAGFCSHNYIALALVGEIKITASEFSLCSSQALDALWEECLLAEEHGHLDNEVIDRAGCILMRQGTSAASSHDTTPSVELLKAVVERGLVGYLRDKTSEGLVHLDSLGPQLLEEAFNDLNERKRINIIALLLERGVELPRAPGWSTERFFDVIDHMLEEWGTVAHAKVLESLLANGVDVNSRSGARPTWGYVIVQSLSVQPPERTLKVLQQLLRYGADPNGRYTASRKRSTWEVFLAKFSQIDIYSINSCHANIIEEFLRYGADPLVSISTPMQRLSLLSLVNQYFPYESTRQLQRVLEEEMDHHRCRLIPANG